MVTIRSPICARIVEIKLNETFKRSFAHFSALSKALDVPFYRF